jgi:methylmalonyl-CoA mutase cobalamin-binding domain/chain
MMKEYLDNITKAVADLDLDEVDTLVKEALGAGVKPFSLLEAMNSGMVKVGGFFEQGKYYLADLVLAGEIMKRGVKVLEPHFDVKSLRRKGTVVLCTVKGDIHDIGKNLVANMLSGSGFEVIDLGVDVHESRVVEAVRSKGAMALGLSVLLTPMVKSVSDVVSALSAAGLREKVKIAIGGACTTKDLAQRLGVDAVGQDPIEAVRIFESFLGCSDALKIKEMIAAR